MDTKPQDGIEPKDVLLFVPTLASTMAVVWEIAKFVPFGGFQYFTLSDHLLAAIQALPTALFAVVSLGIASWIFTPAMALAIERSRSRPIAASVLIASSLGATSGYIFLSTRTDPFVTACRIVSGLGSGH